MKKVKITVKKIVVHKDLIDEYENKLENACKTLKLNLTNFEEIVSSQIYKEDYETVTKAMMFKYLPYEEAIKAIEKIIESGVFKQNIV